MISQYNGRLFTRHLSPCSRMTKKSTFEVTPSPNRHPAMRQAMADAEVGDAVIDIDPTVERFEQMTAEISAKKPPSMCPVARWPTKLPSDCIVIAAASSSVRPIVTSITTSKRPMLNCRAGGTADRGAGRCDQGQQLVGLIHPENDHHPRTRLICLENTHNRWGGRLQPQRRSTASL